MKIWTVGAEVGESPFWDEALRSLFWIDVRKPALHQFSREGTHTASWPMPCPIGAFALIEDEPAALVALSTGLALLNMESGSLEALHDPEPQHSFNRLNEGKVSPCGHWFLFGSMHDHDPTLPTGSLYCLSHNGTVVRLAGDLKAPNGLAWSPSGESLYFSDSREPAIWICDWSAEDGTISNRRVFAKLSEQQGRPDGACVDSHGNYWSAGVSAGCINRFTPDGELAETIKLPVQAPTMPVFGSGDSEGSMFVTSHRRCAVPKAHDGSIVELRVPHAGLKQPRFRTCRKKFFAKAQRQSGEFSVLPGNYPMT